MDIFNFAQRRIAIISRDDWRELTSLLNDSEIALMKKRRAKFANAAYETKAAKQIIAAWEEHTGHTMSLQDIRYVTGHVTFVVDEEHYSTILDDSIGRRHLFLNVHPYVEDAQQWLDAGEREFAGGLLEPDVEPDVEQEEPSASSEEYYEQQTESGEAPDIAPYEEYPEDEEAESEVADEEQAESETSNEEFVPAAEETVVGNSMNSEGIVGAAGMDTHEDLLEEDKEESGAFENSIDDSTVNDTENRQDNIDSNESVASVPVENTDNDDERNKEQQVKEPEPRDASDLLLRIIREGSAEDRIAIASGWDFPEWLFAEMLDLDDTEITATIASNPLAPVTILESIDPGKDASLYELLAKNTASNDNVFFRIMEGKPTIKIYSIIAENPSASLKVLNHLTDIALRNNYEIILKILIQRLIKLAKQDQSNRKIESVQ